jgi:protein-S-isoprenylcysteine O-methyltransferase Ste14
MHGEDLGSYAYGYWSLVAINAGLFVFFILSFLAPVKKREWRSMGIATAFFVALFTEMYGFPLTIYLLTAWLGSRYPALNPFSHASGHLWVTLVGGGNATLWTVHLVSNGLAVAGFVLMWAGWKRIHGAKGDLVTEGPYRHLRHPQYAGLLLVTVGMLIQWPTVLTVLMWPVLAVVYGRLAKREEREMEAQFGEAYRQYRAVTPAFLPRLTQSAQGA